MRTPATGERPIDYPRKKPMNNKMDKDERRLVKAGFEDDWISNQDWIRVSRINDLIMKAKKNTEVEE